MDKTDKAMIHIDALDGAITYIKQILYEQHNCEIRISMLEKQVAYLKDALEVYASGANDHGKLAKEVIKFSLDPV